jgi:hypothetical protein
VLNRLTAPYVSDHVTGHRDECPPGCGSHASVLKRAGGKPWHANLESGPSWRAKMP